MAMPAATETFNDSFFPRMGSETIASHFFKTDSGTPSTSLPKIRTAGKEMLNFLISVLFFVFSKAMTDIFSFLNFCKSFFKSSHFSPRPKLFFQSFCLPEFCATYFYPADTACIRSSIFYLFQLHQSCGK